MATPESITNGFSLNTQMPDQYFSNAHYTGPPEGQSPMVTNLITPSASVPPTPGSLAGRKRSRGDIFSNDEELQPDGSLPTPEQDRFADDIVTNQINLVHPHSAAVTTLPEEMDVSMEAASTQGFQPQHTSRPSMSSRKSQRVDHSASDQDHLAQLVLPNEMREATTQPLIDEATRSLGISWTRMDSSESTRISQAAYSKFIQNHYPSLKNVDVWFENKALPGYLVVATNAYTGQQEFYIFSITLLEARLVTRDAADLLSRLQLLPRLELAAPGGHIKAELDSATASQNEVNNVFESAADEASSLTVKEPVAPRGRSADPAWRYRELLCTAHEMELD